MPVFGMADIKIPDTAWVPDSAGAGHHIGHRHGGRYLSRSETVDTLEGTPLDTDLIALIEFPSKEAVTAFATDPLYAPFAAARRSGSDSRLQLIDGNDVAGTISYLPKG